MRNFINEVKNKQAILCHAKKTCSTEGGEAEGQQLQLTASFCLKPNVTHRATSTQCHTGRLAGRGSIVEV